MESFSKRERERKKREKQKEKRYRRQQRSEIANAPKAEFPPDSSSSTEPLEQPATESAPRPNEVTS